MQIVEYSFSTTLGVAVEGELCRIISCHQAFENLADDRIIEIVDDSWIRCFSTYTHTYIYIYIHIYIRNIRMYTYTHAFVTGKKQAIRMPHNFRPVVVTNL